MQERPYPGLRPFTRQEAHLFFGRDAQTDHLADKLAQTRFLAVTGLSGCGKSSLVRAGLLANLELGYMTEAGPEWWILEMRPGMAPLRNLAQAMLEAGWQDAPWIAGILPASEASRMLAIQGGPDSEADRMSAIPALAQRLAAGGHLEFARLCGSPASRNVLLLVDQFEELFRYERQGDLEERKFFVELLLTSAEQRDVNIYVVITLRSDWLGHCAQFRGLPETINAGQFLVPRLTRDQMRLAMVGPAQFVGGAIEDRLVLRLLDESELNSDQLPVLQHCLMRMWGRRTPHSGPLPEGAREQDPLSPALGGDRVRGVSSPCPTTTRLADCSTRSPIMRMKRSTRLRRSSSASRKLCSAV